MNIIKNAAGKWLIELEEDEIKCLCSYFVYEDKCGKCPHFTGSIFIQKQCQIKQPEERPCNYIAWKIEEALNVHCKES